MKSSKKRFGGEYNSDFKKSFGGLRFINHPLTVEFYPK